MKRTIKQAGIMLFIISCILFTQGCSSEVPTQVQTDSENILSTNEQEDHETGNSFSEDASKGNEASNETENNFSKDAQMDTNRERFYEEADSQGIDRANAEAYLQTLLEDDVFQDGVMELTGLLIEDMDENGKPDMLVTVVKAEEKSWYGSGCLWLYMNDDEPYCFADEDCSYYGYFNAFSADIDNDENIEIVFSAQGSGVGAVGDSYKAIFKYKNHGIERMALPSDLNDDYDRGLKVIVTQNPEENSYGAYCPYFDEIISFSALNGMEPPDNTQIVGGNVRGFFDLQCVEYEGKNALQASEYLNGECGIVHCVAIAQFLIVWDENGEASVAKWWILMDEDTQGDSPDSRIVYTDDAATARLRG